MRAYLNAAGKDALEGSAMLEYLYHDAEDTKMTHLGQGTEFVGTFKNIGIVLVWPCKDGVYFDTRSSQMVWREDIKLSRAELRYAGRFTDNGSLADTIYFLPSSQLYHALPELPQTAPPLQATSQSSSWSYAHTDTSWEKPNYRFAFHPRELLLSTTSG